MRHKILFLIAICKNMSKRVILCKVGKYKPHEGTIGPNIPKRWGTFFLHISKRLHKKLAKYYIAFLRSHPPLPYMKKIRKFRLTY
jgi:hypothetical protein